MNPRGGSLAALVVAVAMLWPAGGAAQGTSEAGAELPEQLRVISGVRFRGLSRLDRRQLKAARLKTRGPSRLPWRELPALRLDYLRSDTASIAALYRHYGYLDATANWVLESTRDPAAARVVFVVNKGRRARVGEVRLEGVHAFHERELTRQLLARPGRPFDPAFLPLDTLHLSALYQERGHRPHTEASFRRGAPDSLAVSVHYSIAEGPRYTIGRIEYEGLGRLRESLARRELLLKSGDVYKRSRLEQSVQRLYDTGLYRQVQVSSLTDSTGQQLDLFLRVAERKSRWVDVGVGSGSADLFRSTASWGHRNLDTRALLGSLIGELAIDRQRKGALDDSQVLRMRNGRASANLIEPWLLGLRLQGRLSVFYDDANDDRDYRFLQRRDSRGFEVGVAREFSRLFRGSVTAHTAFVHQSYDIFLSSIPDSTRDSLNSVLGRYWDNGVAVSLVRDTRDDRITPTRGSMQTVIGEVAGGPLPGKSSYEKLQLVSNWYSPRSNGWVIAARFSGGVMGPIGDASDRFSLGDARVARVPKERRFFIGGVNSLRGWQENEIPGDGGLAMLLGNAELRIPLVGPFGAEMFVDAGNVWARPEHMKLGDFVGPWDPRRGQPNDLRYSFGVGARLLLPFGPLRMDLAWSRHPGFSSDEVFGRWVPFTVQFAIGPSF